MAITQAQADKNWQDSPSTSTPIMSADLKAVSKRNRDYRWMVPTAAGLINATVATATGSQGGNPAAAFDGSIPNDYEASSATVPQWLQAQLTAALPVSSYTLTPRSTWYDQAPRDWTLQGSNDGTTFTVLDTRTGITFTTDSAVQFSFTNSTPYLYYRLNVTAINGSTTRMSIAEMTLAGKGSMTSIDEFDDDTLDPAWLRVDTATQAPAANVTYTERGDSLSVLINGGDTTYVHGLMRPLSGAGGPVVPGDAFVVALHLLNANAGNFTMGGIALSDGVTAGTGQQVWALAYLGGGTTTVNLWDSAGWTSANRQGDGTVPGCSFFYRLVCISATTWRYDVSPDGVSWVPSPATLTKSNITPTHVGLLSSSWGSTTKGVVKYEFLRRVSGV